MIPSVSVRRSKAASASSSVQGTYVARPGVAQGGVLGADARVVEPGRDRVRVGDLAVLVGEHERAGAVQHRDAARAEAGRARRLDADEPDLGVVDEAGEHADRVRAAADAGDDGLGQASLAREDLLARLARRSRAWSSRTISG